jgi:transposase
MPGARISMSKIREVIRLHEVARMSIRAISRAVEVSRPVVDQYLVQARRAGLRWAQVEEMSDEELLDRLQHSQERIEEPRYVELLKRLPAIVCELGKKHVTRQLVWEEYRRECPDGYEYSQFCYHIQVFTADTEISMHLEHEPGKELFVDFAGDGPHLTDPRTKIERRVELFVAVLPSSGLIYARSLYSQKTEDLIRGTRGAFEYAGGAPTIVVPDNLKSAVTRSDRYEPEINQMFEDFGRYYGCVVIPARPARPRDKALVEAAVNLVYTRVLAPLRNRTFSTLDELNAVIDEYVDLLNDREMKKIRISRRRRFQQIEAQHLKALPVRPYLIRRFIPSVAVQVNYHLYFPVDKHYYSVPYRYRRKKVRVAYTDQEVEIYHNNTRIAAHRRQRAAHQYTTNRDHMPSHHRIVTEWNPQRFLTWASEIGEQTRTLIAAVLAAREVPEQAYKSCLGILSLAKKYGPQRLEAACRRANHFRITTYKSVKGILDRGLDQEALKRPLQIAIPSHENIRGSQYYMAGTGSDA